MIKKLTIKEYAQSVGKTKEAILYQIKKGKIKAEKNKSGLWIISFSEEKLETKTEENKSLENTFLKKELELKNEILQEKEKNILKEKEVLKNELLKQEIEQLKILLIQKDEIIKSKNQTIQAEQRTIISLTENIKNIQQKQIENREVKKETIEIKNKKSFWKFWKK